MSLDEGAAISLLRRAVELDTRKRYTEALICYKEGLHLLMEVIKVTSEEAKKNAFRAKATEYMDRAETLSKHIDAQKRSGQFHEQIRIEADSTGHSYKSLFGRFLDQHVRTVQVEDPYIRGHHQIMNFLRLCELLVKSCSNLREIKLLTGAEPSPQGRSEQVSKLEELQRDLETKNIELKISYSETLHDREIQLNTGWLIKIGRGLDIYKPPKGKTVLGLFDLELRPCHQTVVDIFHKDSMIHK